MKKSKETMKIVFEGQMHQIDANTLINFLIHYNTVVSAANNEIGDGARKIIVKVNAIEKGSFVIDLELAQNVLVDLFSADTVDYLAGMVGVVGGVYALYKKRKGKPVKDNDSRTTLTIEKSDSAIIINNSTISIYNRPAVREAISSSIESIDKDEAVDGFRIDTKTGTAVQIGKEEFHELIYDGVSDEYLLPADKIIVDENAVLGITKLSFEKGFTWGFVYNGFKISIKVQDDDLMKHVDNGARFAKGDYIKVKLEITQKYNEDFRVYENKSYKILDFMEHIQCPNQGEMF